MARTSSEASLILRSGSRNADQQSQFHSKNNSRQDSLIKAFSGKKVRLNQMWNLDNEAWIHSESEPEPALLEAHTYAKCSQGNEHNTHTHWNPFLFSKCLETQSKTQGLGFTSAPFYVCGLAGKNHLGPAAAESSQQGPAFMLLHAAQLKTISTIQIFSAKSTS